MKDKTVLYMMHSCFAFISQMWRAGIVFFIAAISDNDLFLVSLTGFCSSLSIVLFASRIGMQVDRTNRLSAVQIGLVVKIISVTCAYAVCATIFHQSRKETNSGDNSQFGGLIYLIPIFYSSSQLAFNIMNMCVEKDWVVVLSQGDSLWLTSVNSTLTMIDLTSESLAPMVVAFLFEYSLSTAGLVLICSNFLASAFYLALLRYIYFKTPELAHRKAVEEADCHSRKALSSASVDGVPDDDGTPVMTEKMIPVAAATSTTSGTATIEGNNNNNNTISAMGTTVILCSNTSSVSGGLKYETNAFVEMANNEGINESSANTLEKEKKRSIGKQHGAIKSGSSPDAKLPPTKSVDHLFTHVRSFFDAVQEAVSLFSNTPCVGVMVAFACLFLSVLSYGAVMTVYLLTHLSKRNVGLAKGGSAIVGFLGAAFYPLLVRRIGIWNTGWWAIWGQALFVSIASVALLCTAILPPNYSFSIFVLTALASRAGLWIFDLVARQIAQESIPVATRGSVNGTWNALISLFDLSTFALGMLFSRSADFPVLACVSAGMTICAGATYSLSYRNNTFGGIPKDPVARELDRDFRALLPINKNNNSTINNNNNNSNNSLSNDDSYDHVRSITEQGESEGWDNGSGIDYNSDAMCGETAAAAPASSFSGVGTSPVIAVVGSEEAVNPISALWNMCTAKGESGVMDVKSSDNDRRFAGRGGGNVSYSEISSESQHNFTSVEL